MEPDHTTRVAGLILFFVGIICYVWLGMRSRSQSMRVAAQWGNDASYCWSNGKTRLMVGVVGMTAAVFLPTPVKEFIFFTSMGLGLLVGEWRVGTGFKLVADAQDTSHRWFERDLQLGDRIVPETESDSGESQIAKSKGVTWWTRIRSRLSSHLR